MTVVPPVLTYGSVCSGIEAATVAWEPLSSLRPLWFAEIEAEEAIDAEGKPTGAMQYRHGFPSALLAERYPGVPNLGNILTIAARIRAGEVPAPDVLVGGTPCTGFSVAGLRESLSDPRSNLALAFIQVANAIDTVRAVAGKPPAFILWENVPGVFSTRDNAFGAFLGGLCGSDSALVPAGSGREGGGRGRWTDAGVVDGPQRRAAWRVLDARYFGLAQRRERVFVLARAGAGDWSAADALLPVVDRLRWHPAPSSKAGAGVAAHP